MDQLPAVDSSKVTSILHGICGATVPTRLYGVGSRGSNQAEIILHHMVTQQIHDDAHLKGNSKG